MSTTVFMSKIHRTRSNSLKIPAWPIRLGRKAVVPILGGALALIAVQVQAGFISPATINFAECGVTSAFIDRTDCVGQVTDPKNDVDGNPRTLLEYLNQGQITIGNGKNAVTDPNPYISINPNGVDPWGEVGKWVGISEQINANGSISGTSTDGLFTVTEITGLLGGEWTFQLTQDLISYLVVTVKDGAGWSGYYYDLTSKAVSSFTNTWDTKGITDGSGKAKPNVSHMFAAYISRPNTLPPPPPPGEGPPTFSVPEPAPLTLMAMGALLLGWLNRRRVLQT